MSQLGVDWKSLRFHGSKRRKTELSPTGNPGRGSEQYFKDKGNRPGNYEGGHGYHETERAGNGTRTALAPVCSEQIYVGRWLR